MAYEIGQQVKIKTYIPQTTQGTPDPHDPVHRPDAALLEEDGI